MQHTIARLFALLLLLTATTLQADDDPARWVDPMIGTGGHGHTYPGATLPFGMVQLSPDTRLEGWDGCSGYHFTDDVIYGFSHTHLSGTGIPDYGDILLMPRVGEPTVVNGYGASPDEGYASRFLKDTERAEPGYYAVHLADYDIGVELTATERAGFHRYTLPPGQDAHVVVDLTHRDTTKDAALRVVGDREIEGFRRSSSWARDQVVYFVARFSRPFDGASFHGGVTELQGTSTAGILSFGDAGGELLVEVAISAVDTEGARRNLNAELPAGGFDAVRQAARQRWNDALGRIRVGGASEEEHTLFYTALYHSLLAPNIFSDVDGRYRGLDRKVHHAEGRRHYTVFSLWDTFRATHPLYTLIERQRTREFLQTFLAMYREGGRLPVWELAGNETDTMIGYHSIPVIADAYLKGIRGFDEDLALEAMLDSATRDHFGLEAYQRQGFVGGRDDNESVSKTLEYAFDDFCIAKMAGALQRRETQQELLRRSQSWRHLLDPETLFMRARRNQRWLTPFDPRRVDNNYTEANSWQYSLFVPHDVEGLIDAFGGEDAFLKRLDALFTADSATLGREQVDITGLIGQYAHGNEPSHHMAWLYHYAGRPEKSADRVHEILTTLYTTAPDGLSGNEDCGQMSSWYVLASMGLYPVSACTSDYVVVPPLFDEVEMSFEDGKSFKIRGEGEGAYITSASLNGENLSRSYLRHAEIIAGGELVLRLGTEPGASWGRAPTDRPASSVGGERVLAAPFAVADSDVFQDRLTVELKTAEKDATIRYALGDAFEIYETPLVIEDSTTIRFFAERRGGKSPVVEASFHRIPHDWKVELTEAPSPQYTAGGAMALLDGQRGQKNWRVGGFQGYRDDFEATVDLGERLAIDGVGASFLQETRAWIWMPSEVLVAVSDDGTDFREVARFSHEVPADDYEGVFLNDLTVDLEGVKGRYVRLTAKNFGVCPDWHPGAGGEAWIFVDEILISVP